MTKKEIKTIVHREWGSFLESQGYKPCKVSPAIIADYDKSDKLYYYGFGCYVIKYDVFKLVYGFGFGFNRIVEILNLIDAQVPLDNNPYIVSHSVTAISPSLLRDPLDPEMGYKYFGTEEELISILEEVKVFYHAEYIPFVEKFSDIRELDKQFNSFDNFYTTGWGKFPSLHFFYVTRLIIAWLAKNPEYDKVVETQFQILEKIWKEAGLVYDRFDQRKPEVFAVQFLQDLPVE